MYIWDYRYLAKIADELGQNKVKKELSNALQHTPGSWNHFEMTAPVFT
jgi:ferritin-like metal-binding protein YciE